VKKAQRRDGSPKNPAPKQKPPKKPVPTGGSAKKTGQPKKPAAQKSMMDIFDDLEKKRVAESPQVKPRIR
jgi:hypothetical protein